MRRAAALFAAACLLASCAVVGSVPPLRTYRLDYPAPPPDAGLPAPGALRVMPFRIADAANRLGFVYRDNRYEVGVDPYHRWIAPPEGMIADLIARDLAAARVVGAVLQGPSPLAAAWELGGQVEALEETPDGGCTAHLRLRALLVRVPDKGVRTVLFEDTFSADQPCIAGDPESFAAAMSLAVQQVSDALRARLTAAVTTPTPSAPRASHSRMIARVPAPA